METPIISRLCNKIALLSEFLISELYIPQVALLHRPYSLNLCALYRQGAALYLFWSLGKRLRAQIFLDSQLPAAAWAQPTELTTCRAVAIMGGRAVGCLLSSLVLREQNRAKPTESLDRSRLLPSQMCDKICQPLL